MYSSVRLTKRIKELLIIAVVVCTCALVVFPIYWLINSSLQEESALFTSPPSFIPRMFSVRAYRDLAVEGKMLRWIRNSLFVSVSTVAITITFGTLAGYSFSRFRYKGRTALSLAILSTQMIAGPMVITPLYIVFTRMGLIDTLYALILANTALNLAVCTWLMKGFFDTIPREIEEAARIDGCGRMGTLFRIVLPLSMTGMVTVLVLGFFVAWNEYLFGLVFISDQDKWIGSVGLASFVGSYIISQDKIMAGAVIFSLLPMLFFLFFQRYIVVGITRGALKG